ncbi:MAG: hypothetical protein ACOCW9_02620 [Thermodesulfobacteriota bacterium]
MTSSEEKKEGLSQKSEELFNLAIDREDIKQMVEILPKDTEINPVAVEYELQLLKILTVGWGISFFLEEHHEKTVLAETFWESVRTFAQSISTMTSSTTGREIDYFSTLKERVEIYVNALQVYSDVDDPSAVIGPTFAKVCGDEENPLVIASGRSIFSRTLQETRKILASAGMV